MGKIIAKAQITNGGPVILYQPENEYLSLDVIDTKYIPIVEDQARKAGIIVPFMNNDPKPLGQNAPGTGAGAVDIYGHDAYPLGFDCGNPTSWGGTALPVTFRTLHQIESPSTAYSIAEFQGGSFDPWGGWGFDRCAELTSHEQVRVFYKNNYAAGVAIFNIYMIFGGTNWGNIGHPSGYTSYDYGAAIAEDRSVAREKYSELKLEAQFLRVSPGYLTATPGLTGTIWVYANNAAVTVTSNIGNNGSFFVVRHTDYQKTSYDGYKLSLPTSQGTIKIPQLGGDLNLTRRDTKIHVTDYPLGNVAMLLYSTPEIFTWQTFENRTVLVVYSGPSELHEIAVKNSSLDWTTDGTGIKMQRINGNIVGQWQTSTERRIIKIGSLQIYVLDRNSAYNYWVPDLTVSGSSSPSSLIVNGPYLVRSASMNGNTLALRADFNKTTAVEIIGVPSSVSNLIINNDSYSYTINAQGNWVANVTYNLPTFTIPTLASLDWKYIDSLPEIQPGYDDSRWTNADHTTTNNSNILVQTLKTPVSLFASDYGYHAGALLFRGHFTSQGTEAQLSLSVQGGNAFGFSAWLNGTFLGSWTGTDAAASNGSTFHFNPPLVNGSQYVITILVDNMGLNENFVAGLDQMKNARGILDYSLSDGHSKSTPITWKLTGNLGGEAYADRSRGPLNEGGLFAERMGYHLSSPPVSTKFVSGTSPLKGITSPGVAFYTTNVQLNLPADKWDIPLTFNFVNSTTSGTTGTYRAWLYVNGFQFGRYVNNIGPQKSFPVPEGILNYNGDNWVALAVWALESGGATVPGFSLNIGSTPVLTGREKVVVVDAGSWKERASAY
jgi:hypothetical protein